MPIQEFQPELESQLLDALQHGGLYFPCVDNDEHLICLNVYRELDDQPDPTHRMGTQEFFENYGTLIFTQSAKDHWDEVKIAFDLEDAFLEPLTPTSLYLIAKQTFRFLLSFDNHPDHLYRLDHEYFIPLYKSVVHENPYLPSPMDFMDFSSGYIKKETLMCIPVPKYINDGLLDQRSIFLYTKAYNYDDATDLMTRLFYYELLEEDTQTLATHFHQDSQTYKSTIDRQMVEHILDHIPLFHYLFDQVFKDFQLLKLDYMTIWGRLHGELIAVSFSSCCDEIIYQNASKGLLEKGANSAYMVNLDHFDVTVVGRLQN